MSGDDEKVIDFVSAAGLPSPSDVLDNPQAYQPGHMAAETPKPKRFARPAATPAGDAEPAGGPESFDPESGDYKAFGRAVGGMVPTLRIILKDDSEWPIVYAHLDTNPLAGSRFLPTVPGRKGNLILLRVAGHDGVFLVAIEGVRLRRVWELILMHRTAWIRELPPDAQLIGDKEPVIWSITAKDVTPKE